ncbi:4-(cytidine 5'-diphospho)-2-C-methyl-D-erythritol kinase [Candidimonas humi]|uniref:4-diphosphocytidyl-2-C-methyl-D-erythritol kinase n=1 Tax=Candidimonas humi TaxID=683355 RepID=A0ABV8P3F6_9BURK|nr:4-(cytidine 5'-diphospho)-2-C-methyl-D-erythritol kinase [Candidimonas humi]MBV6306178.1 4-(cytidine 5'-diphospho)-2-C-methyl-D-erythritol kinase [Candidimonas humi]
MRLYDVPAPAKLNLFLHVVGRRADGYHLLQTVFRYIGLYDTLDFERRGDGRIECESGLAGLAHEDDLVVRAARALQRATGTSYGAQIRCRKQIPAGGGLGGGSSDAATTLIALNRLWETGLDRQALMALALPLGADVPVFVNGRSAFAQGVGEELEPVDLPERAYVVMQPCEAVPTAGVFAAPELTRNTPSVKMAVFSEWQQTGAGKLRESLDAGLFEPQNGLQKNRENGSSEGFRGSLRAGRHNAASLVRGNVLFGRNDLEPVVCGRYPRIQELASWLRQEGWNARMTGSGSCFFVEFVTMDQARLCQAEIAGKITRAGAGKPLLVETAWACPGLHDHPLRHWIHG